jgi:hypothetical protein
MSAQKSLPVFVEHDLSRWPRLAFGYEFIRANGPVASEELGRAWRLRSPFARRYSTADWDTSAGNAIGKSLRKRGLVRERRKTPRGWYAVDERGKALRKPGAEEVDWAGFGDG